ncbi:hypothetical protein Tco_0184282 [Tanacetum coccineum]
MEKLKSENVSLEFQVQYLIKERDNVKTEYQKLFDLIKRTRTQTQVEINELIENVNPKTYAYTDVCAQNQDLLITISELKGKLKNIEKGLRAISSVRRPSHRDSSFKDGVLFNTKNSSEKVEVFDRLNKKPDVASKHVDSNKKIVTNDDIKNALIAKNVLCVSCAKIIVKYQFDDTTPVVSKTWFSVKTVQSKYLDTTPVVSKTKIVAVTPLSAKYKVSSDFKMQDSSSNCMWIVDSGCSNHMIGDRSLLKNFVEKFIGTIRFRNDPFAAITGYGDYLQGNIIVCHERIEKTKRSKNDQKPTRNERDKNKNEETSQRSQPDQPDTARNEVKSQIKSQRAKVDKCSKIRGLLEVLKSKGPKLPKDESVLLEKKLKKERTRTKVVISKPIFTLERGG